MKHKVVSIITALMMLCAATFIIGCEQPQKPAHELNGVWKISASGANTYLTHIYVESTAVYAATNAAGSFTKNPLTVTIGTDGKISIGGTTYTPVKNGGKVNLQVNGAIAYTMERDSSVTADTIKNAPAAGANQGNTGNNQGNNQGNSGNNQGNNQGNTNPLVGVWKVTKDDQPSHGITIYLLFTEDNRMITAIKPKTQGSATQSAMDTGLRRSSRESKYTVSAKDHSFTFPVNSKPETLFYTLQENGSKLTVKGQKEFEAVKVSSPTEDEIKNAQTYD